MADESIPDLIEDYLADQLSDEGKAALAQWLDEDSAHQQEFRRVVELECFLDEQLNNDEDKLLTPMPSKTGRVPQYLGLAAMLVLSFTLAGLLWMSVNSPTADDAEGGAFLARLSHVGADAVFSGRHDLARTTGSPLGKGWVQLDQGSVEIEFGSGATVMLTGPAVFGIDHENRGFLDSGQAEVYAPDQVQDFVLGTAQMEVVDLGTRFHIDLRESEAAVTVKEGLVDLHTGGEGMPRQIRSLSAGLQASVSSSGEIRWVDGQPTDPDIAKTTGLLAHWHMDSLAAGQPVIDASGNGRDGTLVHAVGVAHIAGVSGGAADLKEGGYIDISDHAELFTGGRTFTFSAWVKNANNMFFSISDGTQKNRVQFERWGGRLIYGWQQGAMFDAVQGNVSDWQDDRWHHVVVTASGPQISLYFDGVPLVSRSTGQRINSDSVIPADMPAADRSYIGYLPANHHDGPQKLEGMIDDVQLYGRALDEESIRYLFENPGETIL